MPCHAMPCSCCAVLCCCAALRGAAMCCSPAQIINNAAAGTAISALPCPACSTDGRSKAATAPCSHSFSPRPGYA
ncbi:hypothetical protein GGS21DRAFT_513942 [Xylaria nigripes]|nr:hypothetical protein GGS21DRAFT_513942 [Xylaria nigripes]